jgi:hypothetical protein
LGLPLGLLCGLPLGLLSGLLVPRERSGEGWVVAMALGSRQLSCDQRSEFGFLAVGSDLVAGDR